LAFPKLRNTVGSCLSGSKVNLADYWCMPFCHKTPWCKETSGGKILLGREWQQSTFLTLSGVIAFPDCLLSMPVEAQQHQVSLQLIAPLPLNFCKDCGGGNQNLLLNVGDLMY